jgi:hypothetical protein
MLAPKGNINFMRFLLLMIAVFTITATNAQQLNVRDLEKSRNDNVPIAYDQAGNEIGGNTFECKPLVIVFSAVSYNEKSKEFTIQGKILDNYGIEDSVGLSGVNILQGRLRSDKLTIYSFLGVSNFSIPSNMTSCQGNFNIRVKLRKNCKIYFADPLHYLVEYDINKLIE